jgi:hypothetical protein
MTVDDETFQKYTRATEIAQRQGRPLVEVLDDLGLLRTPIRERDTALTAIKDLITRLEGKTPSDLMVDIWGRAEGTPTDMYHAIMQFMEIWYREFTRVHSATVTRE